MGGVVPAAGSVSACTCGSVADGTAEIVWGADVATWEASGAAGGAGRAQRLTLDRDSRDKGGC